MKPALFAAQFTFTQEADSCGQDEQALEVKLDDAGGGKYFTIETSRWSFDDPIELAELLEQIRKRLGDWWDS